MTPCAVIELLPATLFIVGGAVRDFLQHGQWPHDIDVITLQGNAHELAQQLAQQTGAHLVPLDTELLGTYRLVWGKGQNPVTLDISNALEGSLQADLARRDLTINAMALPAQAAQSLDCSQIQQAVIDFHNGQAHLAQHRIHMVSASNLLEDPLRLLRVCRFATLWADSHIDAATAAVVHTHGHCLLQAAPERIGQEWTKLIEAKHAVCGLQMLQQSGLLKQILPTAILPMPEAVEAFHTLAPQVLLRTAALLETAKLEMAKDFGQRFAWGLKMRKTLKLLLSQWQHCLQPADLLTQLMAFEAWGQHADAVFALAHWHAKTPEQLQHLAHWQQVFQAHAALLTHTPLLTGHQVLACRPDLTAGPALGKLLTQLKHAQWLGTLRTADEAKAWLQQ